jgi:signal transduction histidine kinase
MDSVGSLDESKSSELGEPISSRRQLLSLGTGEASRERQKRVFLSALLLVGLIGVLDWLTGSEISFGIFYMAPVALGAWYCGRNLAFILAAAAAVTWFAADKESGAVYSHLFIPIWNSMVRFAFFLVTALLLLRTRSDSDQLQVQVERRTAALRREIAHRLMLERKLGELTSEEQKRIARDVHDGLGQFLAGLAFRGKSLAQDLKSCACSCQPDAEKLVELLNMATQKTRNLDRVLRPTALEAGGLAAALENLVEETRSLFKVQCEMRLPAEPVPLDEFQSLTVYRIAQEAISNAIKHANARGIKVQVELPAPDRVLLVVEDQGAGFNSHAGIEKGTGLQIMRHRAEMIHAQLAVRSTPGKGCRIECLVPAEANPPLGSSSEA